MALASPVTSSTPGVWTHVVCSGPLPLPLPTTVACSYPRWLGPGRHAKQEHLAQRPDVIGQPRGHGRCPRLPRFGRALAMGGPGLGQRLTEAGMGQTKVVIDMIQHQLLAHACFVFAQRADPSPHRGHMLADGEVDPATVDGGIAPSTSASKPCVP